jgi:hypothetical protein
MKNSILYQTTRRHTAKDSDLCISNLPSDHLGKRSKIYIKKINSGHVTTRPRFECGIFRIKFQRYSCLKMFGIIRVYKTLERPVPPMALTFQLYTNDKKT